MADPTIYTIGGTVQANERGLYIPRQADAELLALCSTATFAYVLAPRQLGKSSLMMRTLQQLLKEDIKCASVDLTQIGTQVTAEQWYQGILLIVAKDLMLTMNVAEWWQANQHLGVTQRLTQFFTQVLLTEVPVNVVIFVDEIDTTLSLDFTDDFYATIRYFHVARATNPKFRRLSFVLIGVATPSDLIRDPRRTPFNIGQRVDLTDFTFEEAEPLTAGLGLPIDETAQQVLRWVLKWTGGHPYLSQRLCRILADRNQAKWSEAEVDRVVDSTFFGNASEQDNNLQFVRDMLTKRAPEITSVLSVYQQVWRSRHPVVDEEQSLVKSHLKLSGVVKREGKTLKIRNAIYRQVFNDTWIGSHLPVNWTKQLQRAAVVLIGLILFSSVPLAVFGLWQADLATKNAKEAETAKKLAEKRQKEAEVAQEAEAKQRRIAVQASKVAEQRRIQAETAKLAEAKQRLIAVQASKVAEQRRIQAEKAKQAEAKQREEADKAKLVQTLAGKALAFRDVFPQRSLLFTVESLNRGKNILRRTEAGALLRRLLGEIGGTPLIGHEKSVVAVVFSPKGNWLATGSKDGKVRLWDKLNPAQPPTILQGSVGEVKAVAISPDGKWLAAIGKNTKIKLWNLTAPKFVNKPLILEGHGNLKDQKAPDPINALSFSPDSKFLATSNGDTTIRLWDLTTKIPASKYILLRGHNAPIGYIVFSPSGRWLATGEADSTKVDINVRLWNMTAISSSAKPIILKAQKYPENNIRGLAFSPDEKRLAAAISSSVQVWDLKSKNLADTSSVIIGRHDQWITAIAFSSDSRWLATGSIDSNVKLWDMPSLNSPQSKSSTCQTDPKYSVCRFVLLGHRARVNAVQFSPDRKWLATASRDGTAKLWNITDLSVPPIVLQGHEGWVNILTFDAKGQWLATASEDTQARLWKVPDVLNDPIILPGIKDKVRANAISPDGKWIASAGDDKIIRLWNATDLLRPPILLTGHTSRIYSLAFSPNRQWLASTGSDRTVRLWDMTNPTAQPHIFKGASFWSMAFSSSGRWLAAGSYDGTVRLWDMKKPSLPTKPSFVLNTQNLGVRSLAFSPDERQLITGGNAAFCSDKLALLWDLTNQNPNANPISLPGHCDVVSDVAFSPDNRWVATAGWDGTVRLWDLTSSKLSVSAKIIKFDPVDRVSQVAFSLDSHWLAAGSWNYQVQLQDMNNLAKEPELLTGHRGRVFGVEFSPDSQWLATSSEDHSIRLWNPTDPTAAPIMLRGHDTSVGHLVFSSNSRWLLSGSNDARLWRVYFNNDDLLNIACRTAGRNLTPQEWQEAFNDQPYHKTCPNLPSKEI